MRTTHADPDRSQSLRLVLVGMMGSGKTTVGRLLSERTGWPYTDNDDLLRRATGREPADIRATDGEDALHDLETEALVEALELPPPSIIGAAAGVVLDPVAVSAIRGSARVIWLRAEPATLRARIGSGAGRREEATDLEWLSRQAVARIALYDDLADLTIDVDDLTLDEVTGSILAWLDAAADTPSYRPRGE